MGLWGSEWVVGDPLEMWVGDLGMGSVGRSRLVVESS